MKIEQERAFEGSEDISVHKTEEPTRVLTTKNIVGAFQHLESCPSF
jgi:hypothetical protein